MRVLFLTPYFPPEVGAPQTRIYDLAVHLANMGHQVSVLTTFPSYPSGVVPKEWRGKLSWKGEERGVTVYRIWSYTAPNRGFLKRIVSHLSFALFATAAGLFLPRSDVAIVESPPLFDGFVGTALKAIRGLPYAFMVSDLWPDSAVQMGILRNPVLIRASKRIELLFYRRAVVILALTSGIRQAIVSNGIDRAKVMLFRNSVDCEFFRPGAGDSRMRAALGLSDSDFVVLYAGNFGLAQNLSSVLQAASLLQKEHRHSIQFVLAGDGAESDLLRAQAVGWGLKNVHFVSSVPKSQMPALINAADCVLVPLRDLPIFHGALPTKLFEGMACAKPVVLGIQGEAEALLSAAGGGYCVSPEVPSAIADAVLKLMNDRSQAIRMGEKGRIFVLRHFSRAARAQELFEGLQRAVATTWCSGNGSRQRSGVRAC